MPLQIPYSEIFMNLPGGKITGFIVLLALVAIIFHILLELIIKVLKVLVGKTETSLDDRVLNAIEKFFPAIATITGLWLSLEVLYPNDISLGKFDTFETYTIIMLAIVGFLLSSIANQVLIWYGIEIRPRKKIVKDEEVFPFVRNIIRILILAVFAIFILQRLGFDTTAIITGLGIGGLAVALALQDTLANFFAGVHILVDKPFREQDYIKMDNGVEGVVTKIGWRTTRLVTITKNEIVIPNSKLSNSVLENFSTPQENSGVYYSVGIDYKEDINKVEKVISDAILRVAKSTELIDPETIWVRLEAFGEYSINLKFGYDIRGYINKLKIMNEVNKELFYAFKKNNIEIPFPVRVVYNKNYK